MTIHRLIVLMTIVSLAGLASLQDASAQQGGAAASVSERSSAGKPADAKAAKKSGNAPSKPARPTAGTNQVQPSANAPNSSERPIPREQLAPIGRVTVPGGSLGYESRTSINAYDLSDGRRVPGYENIQRNDSSYFGLSVRMPMRSHGVD